MQRSAKMTKIKNLELSESQANAGAPPSASAEAGVAGNAKGNFMVFITGLETD